MQIIEHGRIALKVCIEMGGGEVRHDIIHPDVIPDRIHIVICPLASGAVEYFPRDWHWCSGVMTRIFVGQ